MTDIYIDDTNLVVTIEGMDKLWALKSSLTIPLSHVAGADLKPDDVRNWSGLKLGGARVPGVVTAGTFYQDGNKVFWDVHNYKSSIIINLHDETYGSLVVEVADPQAAIKLINQALARS